MELIEDTDYIIQKYTQGYFIMANEMGVLGWYSSCQRALIPLDERFHYPKSLRRILNQKRFSVKINHDFLGVCRGCAERETTWISPQLINIYYNLYEKGWAYSFETWQGNELAGGILGIAVRGAFIGESMFYKVSDASKVAMVKLVEYLKKRDFVLFDAQLQNSHLERFGAYKVSDIKYKILLRQALAKNCVFGNTR